MGIEAPVCGGAFLRWHRQLQLGVRERMLRRVEVLTMASQQGGYPNAFEGESGLGLEHRRSRSNASPHLLQSSKTLETPSPFCTFCSLPAARAPKPEGPPPPPLLTHGARRQVVSWTA